MPETKEKTKYQSLIEAIGKEDGTAEDDALLVAELLDEKGQIIVDLSLPEEYELDIMAQQLLAHLTSYKQNYQAWRAARNTEDHAQAQKLFNQMRYNQLTAAIIQRSYPKAKVLTDEIALVQIKNVKANRKAQLDKEE